jgi:hypothetical protein
MQDGDPGQRPRVRWGGAVFVFFCAAAFLVIAGCAAYFVINLMA